MTTFKEFLLEAPDSISVADFAKKVAVDCAPWLKAFPDVSIYRGIGKTNDPMLRSIPVKNLTKPPYSQALIGAVRNDRRPRDLAKSTHNVLNNLFVSKVGVPLRSASLFVSKSTDTASTYGTVFNILPIGEFHYAWSKYFNDPYSLFVDDQMKSELTRAIEAIMPQVTKKYPKMLKIGDLFKSSAALAYAVSLVPDAWTYDKNLRKCPKNAEIMLVCDKFYAMNGALYKRVREAIE